MLRQALLALTILTGATAGLPSAPQHWILAFHSPQRPIMSIKLGLRNDQHVVTVITPNDSTRPVLGTRHPHTADDEARRKKALAQWGGASHLSRQRQPDTIDEPLSQRSQTILSHELPADMARQLNDKA